MNRLALLQREAHGRCACGGIGRFAFDHGTHLELVCGACRRALSARQAEDRERRAGAAKSGEGRAERRLPVSRELDRRRPIRADVNAPVAPTQDWTRITSAGLYPAPHLSGGLEQNPLPPNKKQVAVCRKWLRLFAKQAARIQRHPSSYGLKHAVEEWRRHLGKPMYVANGALIEAARREGYRIERLGEGSPNARFDLLITRRPLRWDL